MRNVIQSIIMSLSMISIISVAYANEEELSVKTCQVTLEGHLDMHGKFFYMFNSTEELVLKQTFEHWFTEDLNQNKEGCLQWAKSKLKEKHFFKTIVRGGGRVRKNVKVYLYPHEAVVNFHSPEGEYYSDHIKKENE